MKPSEAIEKGLCPSCAGTGQVWKVITEVMGECNTCEGTGVWPPPHALVRDEDHDGVLAIIYGEPLAHRDNCERVKSQRRLLSERRAHRRADKPLFQSRGDLTQLMDRRDPCSCGGIDLTGATDD